MYPLYGVGFWIVCQGESQLDPRPVERLLHGIGSEIGGIIRVYLQGMAKAAEEMMEGLKHLGAGRS